MAYALAEKTAVLIDEGDYRGRGQQSAAFPDVEIALKAIRRSNTRIRR